VPADWVYWLGRGNADPKLLGGKALGLDRLLRLGLPSPSGFCVTTAAYARYLDAAGLRGTIDALTSQLPALAARERLAALSTQHPFPADLHAAVADAAAALSGSDPSLALAVRSSAAGEDAAAASYAGQHATILGVTAAGLETAIRTCWASLWSERAVAYRLSRRLGFADALMAVVVQPVLPAESAAVVFTKHPVTGAADQIVINAAQGLGEAIVSGDITPHTIILDKATLAVRDLVPGDDPSWFPDPALAHHALQTLGELAVRVEALLGAPVDLEAAYAFGQWHLLQARPITT